VPERVSKEERVISMTVEKARQVKELLRESMEGNRLPDEKDDRMEQVKVKRPKAEKDKTKIENQEGTHSGYGKAGETTQFKKMDMTVGDGYAKDLGDSVQFGRYEDKNKNIVVGKSALRSILERYNKEVREKKGMPPLKRLTQITMSSGPTGDFMKFLRDIFNYQ
jgi:hypothetical protein